MDFTVERNQFPSIVHKELYFSARKVTPLEKSLEGLEDPEMRASCTEYYQFVLSLLTDMYDYPEEHDLPVGMLEEFCAGKTVNAMKQKYPAKTKRILAQTGNPERKYMRLFYLLGTMGRVRDGALTLSPGDLEKVRNYFKLKEDNILSSPLLKGLTRVGFKPFGDGFVSTRYPNMFAALCALANRCEKASGFPYFLFCNLEFRNITQKNWWPCVADYFEPLFASQRQTAEELHAFALEHKLRPEISTYWKVGYLYKGKKVMWLSSHDCRLGVNVLGTAAHEDHALINSRLEGESPEFQRQALIHVHRCDACATTHLGVFVWVLGKKQRVCGAGEIAFRWYHPDEKAIDIAKQLIRFRMQIIDELEQSKSEA